MKYIIILFLIILLASCQSTAKYRAIKKSREAGFSQNRSGSGDLEAVINSWVGVPYKYGGMSKRGVDCSGFTSVIYQDLYGIKLPRSAREQYINGTKIRSSQIRSGDLVFFRGVIGTGIDHVGIYLEYGDFIHASTTNGVVISNLDEEYYESRFVGACRY